MSSIRRWPNDVGNQTNTPEDDGPSLPTPRLLKPNEAAAVCRVSIKTIYRWISSGDLKAIRFGRSLRIEVGTLDRFIAENCED